jgi:hypothetical protein
MVMAGAVSECLVLVGLSPFVVKHIILNTLANV